MSTLSRESEHTYVAFPSFAATLTAHVNSENVRRILQKHRILQEYSQNIKYILSTEYHVLLGYADNHQTSSR